MNQFAKQSEINKIVEKMEPQMEYVLGKIDNFEKGVRNQDIKLQDFELLILEKSNKLDVTEIRNQLETLVVKTDFHNFKNEETKRYTQIIEKFKKLDDGLLYMKKQAEDVDKMSASVKKKVDDMKVRVDNTVTVGDVEEVKLLVKAKADKADLAQLYDVKSNRWDTENLMKCIDFLHKQIE